MEIKRRLRPDSKFKLRVPGVRAAERERFGKIIKSALRLGACPRNSQLVM